MRKHDWYMLDTSDSDYTWWKCKRCRIEVGIINSSTVEEENNCIVDCDHVVMYRALG